MEKKKNEPIKFRSILAIVDSSEYALDASDAHIQHYDFAYDGNKLKVVKTTIEDRDAYIQSFADESGVYNILKRYSMTGDMSLLNQKNAMYGDFTLLDNDDLDPVSALARSSESLEKLNQALNTSFDSSTLANMSVEELNAVIAQAVAAKTTKETTKETEAK